MRESELSRKIVRLIRSRGHHAVKNHGSPYAEKGRSDIEACILGRFMAIETKLPGNSATEAQEAYLERVRAAGGFAGVVDNIQLIERALASLPKICMVCLEPLTRTLSEGASIYPGCPQGHGRLVGGEFLRFPQARDG